MEKIMAWELQSHMQNMVAPSIHHHYGEECREALEAIYASQCTDDSCGSWDKYMARAGGMAWDGLVQAIAGKAIEYATTTNGAHEVYLDAWTSIPWCSDDQCLEFYE
jgi:hypothetical protein